MTLEILRVIYPPATIAAMRSNAELVQHGSAGNPQVCAEDLLGLLDSVEKLLTEPVINAS